MYKFLLYKLLVLQLIQDIMREKWSLFKPIWYFTKWKRGNFFIITERNLKNEKYAVKYLNYFINKTNKQEKSKKNSRNCDAIKKRIF